MKSNCTILNIMLVFFIQTCFLLSSLSFKIITDKQISKDIEHMFMQKNIEIIILYNYEKNYQEDGLLLSESYEYESIIIDSNVESLDTDYLIRTTITFDDDNQYSFEVKLNLETGKLYDFTYI